VFEIKKGRLILVYGCFRTSKPSTMPTIAIEAMIAATAGKKYWSVVDCGAVV
jgi:hypothetical protein